MTNDVRYLTMDPEREGALRDTLIKYFRDAGGPGEDNLANADSDFAFVVVGFQRPVTLPESTGTNPRVSRATMVASMMACICPELDFDNTQSAWASAVRVGIHAVCASILARLMDQVSVPQVINTAQYHMAKREELLHD